MKKLLLLLLFLPIIGFGQDCDSNEVDIFVSGLDINLVWSLSNVESLEIIYGGAYDNESICVDDGCWVFSLYNNLGDTIDAWGETQYEIVSNNTPFTGGGLNNELSLNTYIILGDIVPCGCNGYELFSNNPPIYFLNNDPDNDGFCTLDVNSGLPIDNCEFVFNPDQLDSDNDGIGDWCEDGAVGCMDELACNYMPTAITEESCGYVGWVYTVTLPVWVEDYCCYYPFFQECGGESINGVWWPWFYNDNCDCVPFNYDYSVAELSNSKNLITTLNILGRETTNKGFQLHIYDDGSVEKKYLIK